MQCVQEWTNYLDSDGKYKNVEGTEAALWLVEVVKATHLSRLVKAAGRKLMANRLFTRNLQSLKYVDDATGVEHPNSVWTDLIVPTLIERLKVLAAQAEKTNDESGLALGFGPAAGTSALHGSRSTGGVPHGPPHARVADLFYTDVRSILMVFWHFKGTVQCVCSASTFHVSCLKSRVTIWDPQHASWCT